MKRALLIEDREDLLDELEETFRADEIEVIKCSDRDAALEAIRGDVPFDVVVLDWYFVLEGDSALSRQLLREIKGRHFRPVFVYTGEIEDFKNTPQDQIDFPENLLFAFPKTNTVEELKSAILKLVSERYALQIASAYRHTLRLHLEALFFDLNQLKNVDLARVLAKIYGNGANVDWSNDLIFNFVDRYLVV